MAVSLGAAGCGGRTDPTPVAECPGCSYVHSDNPVLTGTAELAVQSGSVEEALRSDDSSWRFNHFELTLAVTGGDAAQGSMNEPDPYTGPVPWPSGRGDWAPAPENPVTFPWEAHGVRVGYNSLTIDAVKRGKAHNTAQALHQVLRLYPDTILVPIQVAELVPDYAGAPSPGITEHEDEATNEVWFDDRWGVHVQKVSAPDGSFDHLSGSFAPRPDSSGATGYYPQIEPDAVFRQCDIQFRMIAFRKVKVPKHIWEMVDAAGHQLCDDASRLSALEHALDLAFQAGLEPSAAVVMYTLSLAGDCHYLDIREACSVESCRYPFAAIAHFNLQSHPHMLSRELGYILGMKDLPFNPDSCSGKPTDPLMCGGKSGFTQTGAGSCSTARRGAAALSNKYYGTHF